MQRLGMQTDKAELTKLINEVDQDGNGEIDFDEFCDVMKRLNAKSNNVNDVVNQCFQVFDRVSRIHTVLANQMTIQTESGAVSSADFRNILYQIGGIRDDSVIEEIFAE